MKKLLAAVLVMVAFGLIASHLHMPVHPRAWRIAPRASQRLDTEMPVAHPNGWVNVNAASLQELDTLPGIGPELARRIVEERTQNGLFHYPEDLLCVRGIGQKTLEKLRNEICIP